MCVSAGVLLSSGATEVFAVPAVLAWAPDPGRIGALIGGGVELVALVVLAAVALGETVTVALTAPVPELPPCSTATMTPPK